MKTEEGRGEGEPVYVVVHTAIGPWDHENDRNGTLDQYDTWHELLICLYKWSWSIPHYITLGLF